MTKDEFLDFYDEHWNDYNAVYDKLLKMIDHYERQIAILKSRQPEPVKHNDSPEEVENLKKLLRECQDRLDEETHKLEKTKQSSSS